MFWLIVHVLLTKVIPVSDETITGYADRSAVYQLIEMNGQPVTTSTTLVFPGRNAVTARTACFRYEGQQSLPYPWFEFELQQRTDYSCIEQAFEAEFRKHLFSADLVETFGNTLILSGEDGPQLVFQIRE